MNLKLEKAVLSNISSVNHQEEFLLKDTEFIHFTIIPDSEANNLRKDFMESPYYALLYIDEEEFTLYSNQQINLNTSSSNMRQDIDAKMLIQ